MAFAPPAVGPLNAVGDVLGQQQIAGADMLALDAAPEHTVVNQARIGLLRLRHGAHAGVHVRGEGDQPDARADQRPASGRHAAKQARGGAPIPLPQEVVGAGQMVLGGEQAGVGGQHALFFGHAQPGGGPAALQPDGGLGRALGGEQGLGVADAAVAGGRRMLGEPGQRHRRVDGGVDGFLRAASQQPLRRPVGVGGDEPADRLELGVVATGAKHGPGHQPVGQRVPACRRQAVGFEQIAGPGGLHRAGVGPALVIGQQAARRLAGRWRCHGGGGLLQAGRPGHQADDDREHPGGTGHRHH